MVFFILIKLKINKFDMNNSCTIIKKIDTNDLPPKWVDQDESHGTNGYSSPYRIFPKG